MKILIFDHTNSERKLSKAMKVVAKYCPFPLLWNIVKVPASSPVFNPKVSNAGQYSIDKNWYRDTFTKKASGYDFCIAYYTSRQWRKPFPKNKSMGQSIEQNFGVSEIALCGSLSFKSSRPLAKGVNESEFAVRLLHEMCHGMFDHKLHVPDVTHYWHYEKKNLLEAIKLWVQKTSREKLYQTALSHIGVDASPSDIVSDSLGCAESVSTLVNKVVPSFPIITGTWSLWDAIRLSGKFVQVMTPECGDIILSVTGTGNGKLSNGHTGIVGLGGIVMSNDSMSGVFSANYTLATWDARYRVLGGFPTLFYRLS